MIGKRLGTIQLRITSAKRWVGGVRKWQFLLIYSTIYADVSGWVGVKSQKHADVILEWSLQRILGTNRYLL